MRLRKWAGKSLSLLLVLAMCLGMTTLLAYAEQAVYQPGTNVESGSASLPKLSKQEIVDLLSAAPITMPDDVFVSLPSCTAPYAVGKVKQEVLDAAAARLSALRRIAGPGPV